MRSQVRTTLLAMLAAACCSGALTGQHGPHQSRVFVGDGEWLSVEEAQERGWFLYEDRWLPKKLRRKVKSWQRADAKVASWDDAYRAKSKHYRIRTNAPRHVTELEIVPFLDELFDMYCEVFESDFGLKAKGVDHQQIHVYWGYATWRDVQERDRGNPGYYVSSGDLHVLYDPTEPDQFYKTVFHEGGHQFFRSLLPGAELPLWLSEALAVYMEGCTFTRSTGELTKGHLPSVRLLLAQRLLDEARQAGEPLTPEAMFMRFERGAFDARHYALAWSYVYYLVHREDGAHKHEFYELLDAMNGAGARSVHEVFERATRKDLHEIDRGWASFVLALQAPNETKRLVLEPLRDDCPVHKGDQLILIDGFDIDGEEAWKRHWLERDRTRPAKLLVRRKSERRGPMDYEQQYVAIELDVAQCDGFVRAGAVPYTKTVLP